MTLCALTRCAARLQPWAADGKALEAAGAVAAADAPADFGSPARRGADKAAAAGDAPALARELADVKKRFVAVAKRKQQEYSKRARRALACRLPVRGAVACYPCFTYSGDAAAWSVCLF